MAEPGNGIYPHTIIYRDYIGLYWGHIGIMENYIETIILYGDYIGVICADWHEKRGPHGHLSLPLAVHGVVGGVRLHSGPPPPKTPKPKQRSPKYVFQGPMYGGDALAMVSQLHCHR